MKGFLKKYAFGIGIILLHGIYFMAALHFGRIYNGDSFEYIYEAVNIKNNFFFYSANPVLPLTEEYMTLRTPGYPLFLLLVYSWAINNWMVLIIQSGLSIFNVFLCRDTFLKLGYQKNYDGWLFLLLLVFPSQLVYAHIIAPDILLQTFTLLYFRFMILFLQKKERKYSMWMSLALIGGIFMKPVLYPYAFIHFPIMLFLGGYFKQFNFRFVSAALLPIICIVAYSGINAKRTGKYHFSSIQSFNAIYYYQRFYTDKVSADAGKAYIQKERTAIAQLPDFAARYDEANERGVSLLLSNFSSYLPYHLSKSALYFLETGRGELDEFTGRMTLAKVYAGQSVKFSTILKNWNRNEIVTYIFNHGSVALALVTLLSNLVKLLGIVLFLLYAPYSKWIKWFVTLFFLYFALITGPIANAHYVMPISLLLMCCAISGFIFTFNKNKKTAV